MLQRYRAVTKRDDVASGDDMPPRRHNAHLYELAKHGAEIQLRELVQEAKNLIGLFPHLRDSFDPDELPLSFIIAKDAGRVTRSGAGRPGRRRRMSAAAGNATSGRIRPHQP
jgi:hypothetical protein